MLRDNGYATISGNGKTETAVVFAATVDSIVAEPNIQQELPPTECDHSVIAHESIVAPASDRARHYTVMAWNINGIRSVLKDGTLRHLLKTYLPTILCLGELKKRADKLAKLRDLLPLLKEFGYHSYHFNTCDAPNTGYSGTAIFARIPPQQFIEGWSPLIDAPSDTEGRVITAVFPNVTVVHTYSPSTGFDRPD